MIDRSKLLNVPYLSSKTTTKRSLSKVLRLLTKNFVAAGGTITQCRPAFAHGVETPLAVRQAIRAEGRA